MNLLHCNDIEMTFCVCVFRQAVHLVRRVSEFMAFLQLVATREVDSSRALIQFA